jgi:YHS domain-containing protein
MKTKPALFLLLAATGLLVSSCASTGGTASAGGIKPYPKDTCIVTGNKLGSMGAPITQVYQGQEIKFCCKPCTKKFAANPAKYLADL